MSSSSGALEPVHSCLLLYEGVGLPGVRKKCSAIVVEEFVKGCEMGGARERLYQVPSSGRVEVALEFGQKFSPLGPSGFEVILLC